MQDKHHDIDKLFQDAFQNHEAAPPFNMWNKIESNLPLTETDLMFKKAFENYEQEPSPEVWERIKPELPLSLTLRNGLVYLSKIAAVLLVGISVYVFAQQFDWQTNNVTEIAQQQKQQQEESTYQEQQEVAQTDSYYEEQVISKTDVINEPLAMLEEEEVSNMLPPGPVEISEMSSDYPLNNPANTAKGGSTLQGKVVPNKVYTKEVIINIDEIAKRVEAGNKERIPSEELYFVNFEEEEASQIDSTKKKDEVKELQNMKMEDAYAVASNVDFDGKIRRPYKTNEAKNTTTAALPYLSLQGKADESFQTKGVRLKRSNLEKAAFDFTGLQFNVNAAFGTSSILNTSLKERMAGGEGQYNLLSLSDNVGLGIGYQFKTKWSVETGVNYINQSQAYTNFADTDRKVNFNYLSIPLTFKYRSNEISGTKPSAISYVFGLQTGFLQRNEIVNFIPTTSPDAQDLAIQQEVAATVGVDYDLFLNPNLSWTIGARATVGTGIENSFDNYNTFIGIRSAFNFRLAK